jgi:hypothetical protein
MSPALVGRLEELEFLQAFVREAAVDGGTLLVSGGPGVGKTSSTPRSGTHGCRGRPFCAWSPRSSRES